jgi:hypothetical protein
MTYRFLATAILQLRLHPHRQLAVRNVIDQSHEILDDGCHGDCTVQECSERVNGSASADYAVGRIRPDDVAIETEESVFQFEMRHTLPFSPKLDYEQTFIVGQWSIP